MANSFKKVPKFPSSTAETEKAEKKYSHRKFRTKVRNFLYRVDLEDEPNLPIKLKEVSKIWLRKENPITEVINKYFRK